MFTKNQGNKLIKLARESIETSFYGNSPENIEEIKQEFSDERGVFVTLHKKGELRGCIGYPRPVLPLYEAVISAARSAAFQDPRFPPLKEDELDIIDVELSVLTPPQEIKADEPKRYLEQIKVGEDGLIIRSHTNSGLLLPQVAEEYGWDVQEFLMHTCHKAGLDTEAWKEDNVKLYKFQAQIFSEEK